MRVRNMAWPRIDQKIWFLLVCFYREKMKFNEKRHLFSSRTWLMSWESEKKKIKWLQRIVMRKLTRM